MRSGPGWCHTTAWTASLQVLALGSGNLGDLVSGGAHRIERHDVVADLPLNDLLGRAGEITAHHGGVKHRRGVHGVIKKNGNGLAGLAFEFEHGYGLVRDAVWVITQAPSAARRVLIATHIHVDTARPETELRRLEFETLAFFSAPNTLSYITLE